MYLVQRQVRPDHPFGSRHAHLGAWPAIGLGDQRNKLPSGK